MRVEGLAESTRQRSPIRHFLSAGGRHDHHLRTSGQELRSGRRQIPGEDPRCQAGQHAGKAAVLRSSGLRHRSNNLRLQTSLPRHQRRRARLVVHGTASAAVHR